MVARMSKRKIAKAILLIGASFIGILLVLFFYISSKVKSEFEEKISFFISSLNETIYKIEYEPFVCKGFFNYECTSKQLKFFVDEHMLFALQKLKIGLKNIRTDSLKEYISGDIVEISDSFLSVPSDFKPLSFEYKNEDKILNQREGIVFNQSFFEIKAKNASYSFSTDFMSKSKDFINKNIIKIILQTPVKTFLENTEYFIQNIKMQIFSHNLKDSVFELLEQTKNNQLNDIEYRKIIDEKTQYLNFVAAIFGLFDTPYKKEISDAIKGFNLLLKDEVKSMRISFISKDQVYFKREYFNKLRNPDDLQRFFAKFFNHYDMEVSTTAVEGK